MAKLTPEAEAFVQRHANVEPASVFAFGDAPHPTQLAVLSVLRGRVHDQSSAVEVVLGATAIAFISLVFTPIAVPENAPFAGRLVIGLMIGAGAATVLLPTFIGPYLRASRQAVAAIWMAAYQDELNRRWAMKGCSARRWQRTRGR